MTINAFHKDFVKTYMPEFLSDMKIEARHKEAGKNLTKYVNKHRKDKPHHGTIFGISEKVVSVKPLDFMLHKKEKKRVKK